jgi:hypothetical protein
MSQIRNAVVIACSLAAAGSSSIAHAEDHAVAHKLSAHGGLSSAAAKKLMTKVSQRMARAADAPPSVMEPLRMALSQALLGTPVAPDQIAAAKVRLKLYAGLNSFALEALFPAHPGAIAACVRDVGITQAECESLIAAAANTSVTQARNNAGGPASYPLVAAAPAAAPGFGSRFGGNQQPAPQAGGYATQGFGGGYHPPVAAYQQQPQAAAGWQQPRASGWQQQQQQQVPVAYQQPQQAYQSAPAAAYQQPAYAARPTYAGAAQAGYNTAGQSNFGARPAGNAPAVAYRPAAPASAPVAAAPAYRPAPAAPVAAAPVYAQQPAPMVNMQEQQARKEAYKAQREAYMARQKQQFEERRVKTAGLDAEPTPPPTPAPAKVAAAPKAPVAKIDPALDDRMASAETKHPVAAAAPAAAASSAAPAAKAGGEKALDGDFLDGLLDDPLGGKGKK